MPDRRKLHLHIGAHKTASSFLASNLRAWREALAAQGLAVVSRHESISTPFAREVYAVAQGRHAAGEVSPGAAKSARRLLKRPGSDVLILNEDLVCRLKIQDFYQNVRPALAHVQAACDGVDPKSPMRPLSPPASLPLQPCQRSGRRLSNGAFGIRNTRN